MTQKITKNQQNKFVLTLSELASEELENNWLFIITREQTKEEVFRGQLPDVSPSPERYNKFEFTEGEGEDIDFQTPGDYEYNCYQMPDDESTDETEGIHVEVGKIRVVESQEIIGYEASTTGKAYSGQ